MSFAANMAAISACLIKRKNSTVFEVAKPNIKRWLVFENKALNHEVRFSDSDLDYVDSIRVSKDEIKHEGVVFRFKYEYLK